MYNGRFSFSTNYFCVQVTQSAYGRVVQLDHLMLIQGVRHQEVIQRPVFTELCNEPQLHLDAHVFAVSRNVTQNIRVTNETGLVDVHLMVPRDLLTSVEDLDSNIVSLVHTSPHLPKPPLSDDVMKNNLGSNGALGEQGEPRPTSRVFDTITALIPTGPRVHSSGGCRG